MHRSHVAQLARRHGLADLDEAVESYTGIVDRLQGTVLSMRMTPAAEVFNRFPRMVRDLARQQGKEVRLEIRGGRAGAGPDDPGKDRRSPGPSAAERGGPRHRVS